MTPGAWTCQSCGAACSGRFCSQCGERRIVDDHGRSIPPRTARTWIARLRASLNALASPPGKLTRDWDEGRRVGYLPPLSLLLWTNVAFFLVQSASGISILSWPLAVHVDNDILGLAKPLLAWRRAQAHMGDAEFAAAFRVLETTYAKSLVIFMVLLLALAPFLTVARQRRTYASYFTYAAHAYTFALIGLSALFPLVSLALTVIYKAGMHPPDEYVDIVVSAFEAAMMGWYFYAAMGTLTSRPPLQRFVRAVLLLAAMVGILRLYHVAVFAVTLVAV